MALGRKKFPILALPDTRSSLRGSMDFLCVPTALHTSRYIPIKVPLTLPTCMSLLLKYKLPVYRDWHVIGTK